MRRTPVAIVPLAIVLVVLLASPAFAGGWSQVGHNGSNMNVADADSTITAANVRDLTGAWGRPLGDEGAVISDGSVFVDPAGHNPLEILDLATGTTTAEIQDVWFQGPPAVSGDTVVVQRPGRVAPNGTLQPAAIAAFSISKGTRLWSHLAAVSASRPNAGVAPPTIADGLVFTGGRSDVDASFDYLPRLAIDLATGAVVHRTESGNDWGGKVAVGDGVFATIRGEDGGRVHVYDETSGKLLWDKRRRSAAVAIAGDRLVVSGNSLSVFDARTGSRWWQDKRRTMLGVAVTDSTIFADTWTTFDHTPTGTAVRALSLFDGTVRWTTTVGGPDDQLTAPIVVNGVVFVGRWNGTTGSILALRKTTGALLWADWLGYEVTNIGPLAAVDDKLFVPIGHAPGEDTNLAVYRVP